ncbi:hypothetical protein VDGL01_11990 [Verticillium dahliae]
MGPLTLGALVQCIGFRDKSKRTATVRINLSRSPNHLLQGELTLRGDFVLEKPAASRDPIQKDIELPILRYLMAHQRSVGELEKLLEEAVQRAEAAERERQEERQRADASEEQTRLTTLDEYIAACHASVFSRFAIETIQDVARGEKKDKIPALLAFHERQMSLSRHTCPGTCAP